MQIIAGTNSIDLAQKLSTHLGIELIPSVTRQFNDGELQVQISSNVNIGSEVCIIQSMAPQVNNSLIELLLLADAIKRTGTIKIKAVVPYLGYSRQDKLTHKHSSIAASLVAILIQNAGINELITIDLHTPQIQGFFTIPTTNISPACLFAPAIANITMPVIVAPDMGSIHRVKKFCSLFGSTTEVVVINKTRQPNGTIHMNHNIMGSTISSINNRDCIIVDDMVDSGSTLCRATELLYEHGAQQVIALITHGIFSNNALANIAASAITAVYVTDSIIQNKTIPKIHVVPILPLIAAHLNKAVDLVD